jgi:hypothetical protein
MQIVPIERLLITDPELDGSKGLNRVFVFLFEGAVQGNHYFRQRA